MDASASTDASHDVNQPAKPEPWCSHRMAATAFSLAPAQPDRARFIFFLLCIYHYISFGRGPEQQPLRAPSRSDFVLGWGQCQPSQTFST